MDVIQKELVDGRAVIDSCRGIIESLGMRSLSTRRMSELGLAMEVLHVDAWLGFPEEFAT